MKKILIFALLILIFSGCVSDKIENTSSTDSETQNNETTVPQDAEDVTMSEVVQNGDKIKVDYKGTLEDGTEFDSSLKEGRTPLEFTAGAGQMIPGFDSAVIGMVVGEEKTVTLQPEDAYGTRDDSRIVEIPMATLTEAEITPEVGMPISSSLGTAIIVEVNDDTVTLDYNHALAGKPLTFWIKIVEIQK
ncbi:MAG: peptidylprolyl isomerase [Candidatus Diapherotrites archaeon]